MSDLKLLDRALRNILCRSPYRLIADIDAIHLNSRRSPKSSPKRDGRESVLRGIEVATILNLHSRLKLRQIEEITSIDGKIVDLLRVEHTLNRRLLCIDMQFGGGHFNHLFGITHLQLHTAGCSDSNLDLDRQLDALEASLFYAYKIIAGDQSPRGIGAR